MATKTIAYNKAGLLSHGEVTTTGIADIDKTGILDNQYLKYNATTQKYFHDTLDPTDLAGLIDASKLGTGVISNTELNYLDGVTSNIQTQLTTISANASTQSDWSAASGVAYIMNKPTLSLVASSGSYVDLINKPTIPSLGNFTVTANTIANTNNATISSTGTITLTGTSVILGTMAYPTSATGAGLILKTTGAGTSAWVSPLNDTYQSSTDGVMNCANGNTFLVNINGAGANIIPTFQNVPSGEFAVHISIVIGGTGTFALTGLNFKFPNGKVPVFTNNGFHSLYAYTLDAGATWYGAALLNIS